MALSAPLLGQVYPAYVWASLLPIVAGCAMSAMKEVSFAWNGFNNAMISNVGMVLRNILSKKSLVNYKVRTPAAAAAAGVAAATAASRGCGCCSCCCSVGAALAAASPERVLLWLLLRACMREGMWRECVCMCVHTQRGRKTVARRPGFCSTLTALSACPATPAPRHTLRLHHAAWPPPALTRPRPLHPPQHIDGINLFGLISIVSLLYCAPAGYIMEGAQWLPAWNAAVESVGKQKMLQMLALSGVFYHLYNQVRVSPA